MERRDFFAKGASLTVGSLVAATAGVAFAQGKKEKPSTHNHSAPAGDKNKAVATASANCVQKGEECLEHCMEMLSTGDKSMAACAKSVRDMMVFCNALQKAANQNSKRTKALAKLAAEACKDCEDECRKHENMETCKACADACAECQKACKAVMG